jgi:hypothetical protein
MVGAALVLQQTPLAVIGVPPSLDTFPETLAFELLIADTLVVADNMGALSLTHLTENPNLKSKEFLLKRLLL